jgi:N,N'-diacetyllegionaminate synthase
MSRMYREMETIELSGHTIGQGMPFVVAEVAQAHDGSLGLAHAHIDAAADAGADAVKFQTHIASAESTRDEPFRVRFSEQDATRFDYWRRMEFTEEQWAGLAAHARERGLVFFSSPFSVEAIELLERLDVPLWKVGSGEVANRALLARLAATGKPVLLSSGMSDFAELDEAVTLLRGGSAVAVLQCTSAYPVAPEQIGLNVLGELRERYRCPVGLSDHSGTIYPSLAAVALGASLLEVHLTIDRRMFGPDVAASITVTELAQLVEGARTIAAALAAPVDKDALARDFAGLRDVFGRSVALRQPLAAGRTISADDLTLKKPGTGIPARDLSSLVGRTLRRDVSADVLLREDDLA